MGWRDVIEGDKKFSVEQADCLSFMNQLPEASVDLVFGSPSYMDARTYNDGTLPEGAVTVRDCQQWVDWMLDVTEAAVRVSKGLVLWVVSGVQRDLCYWPGCEGLAWEWWKRGHHLWRPCIWWKVDEDEGGTGIPGSGGKQWLRNDWEYVLAFKREGWLPWADPLVMGHEPVYAEVGGEMSNRTQDGRRINDAAASGGIPRKERWGGKFESIGNRAANGKRKHKPPEVALFEGVPVEDESDPWDKHGRGNNLGGRSAAGKTKKGTRKKALSEMPPVGAKGADGDQRVKSGHPMPAIANPGNCIIVKSRVGGGHMGSDLCHENEAPFPEMLAEFFVRSFCPPGGICLDCFSGSGTTAAVSLSWGRRFVGCDLRESQVKLTRRRVDLIAPMFPMMV